MRSARKQVDVVVIGGGISGLAAALAAHREGASVVCFEESTRAGGVIRTDAEDGFILEAGPNSMMCTPAIAEIAHDLGLEDRILRPSGAARKRYVLRDGRMHAIPMSPASLAATPLLSARGKLRALGEAIVPRAGTDSPEESLGDFVARRFGPEVRDYLIDPFVSGVYAGDINSLSASHALPTMRNLEQRHGSVLIGAARMAWTKRAEKRGPGMMSFIDGLEELPRAIAQRLGDSLCLGQKVMAISNGPSGWTVEHVHSDGSKRGETGRIVAERLVVAIPAHALGAVDMPAGLRADFSVATAIRHAPVATVSLGFPCANVRHPADGFGVLAPSREGCGILGALFVSSIFPNRAPDGHMLITCFFGGARMRERKGLSAHEITSATLSAVRPLLGISGDPVVQRVTWRESAIPQYELGHSSALEAITRAESRHHGLRLVGSYRGGVSVGDCIAKGLAAGSGS